MNQVEKWMDEYLEDKENEAWRVYKDKVGLDKVKLPKDVVNAIEGAFMIGYSMGSYDGGEQMKQLSKIDPVGFYNWIKEE
ncbi:hypothetical protein [Priestia flexa]|uniref:hypothetical protein n=1 Tax=Priestia flexa TaxID=86664 RepID=UPI000473053E|nr:hypothetical protein [Priestia flexa]